MSDRYFTHPNFGRQALGPIGGPDFTSDRMLEGIKMTPFRRTSDEIHAFSERTTTEYGWYQDNVLLSHAEWLSLPLGTDTDAKP